MNCDMLILYVKTGCPYCGAVLAYARDAGIDFTEKNIAEPGNVDEIIEKGGKRQVPFLVDTEEGIMLYESGLIIEYLKNHYGIEAEQPEHESGCSEC